MKQKIFHIIFLICLLNIYCAGVASGWHDETHLAVAKAAGYSKWYNAAGADITKTKAGEIERYNHFFNNPFDIDITPEFVLQQALRYNSPNHPEGHLYGAIIASLREYQTSYRKGKYPEYHIAFLVHYITDLSQPLHNIPYADYNKKHHVANDGIVDQEAMENIQKIKDVMYLITLNPDNFETDLAKEIARIANSARHFGFRLKKENRNMTKEEAYVQLGHSASLLRAVLEHLGKTYKSSKENY